MGEWIPASCYGYQQVSVQKINRGSNDHRPGYWFFLEIRVVSRVFRDTGFIRNGKSGSGLILTWNKSF